MPLSPTPSPGEEIAEAKAAFDKLLAEQAVAEQEMAAAKDRWAAISAQLLEAHFDLKALVHAAHRSQRFPDHRN